MVTNIFNKLEDIALNKAENFLIDTTAESAINLSIEQIIDEDYIFNGLAKNAIDYITGFNGYTYTLPLRYYIHLKEGPIKLDVNGEYHETLSMGVRQADFIADFLTYIDYLLDLDFERVYSNKESDINIYLSTLPGNTLGINHSRFGQENNHDYYYLSDILWTESIGTDLFQYVGLTDDSAFTIIHELLHSLGLCHPSDDPFDKWHNTNDTLMSYNFIKTGENIPRLSSVDVDALVYLWGGEKDINNPQQVSLYDLETTSTLEIIRTAFLDVDSDSNVTAFGDGLMVIRKLFGSAFEGDALTAKAVSVGATRSTEEIHEYIQGGVDDLTLDVDGDGKVTAFGDGLMVIRKLFGSAFTGDALTAKAISADATRDTDEIHEYISAMTTFDPIG